MAHLHCPVESGKKQPFGSAQATCEVLFQGLDPANIDYSPVLYMAAEFFTRLSVARKQKSLLVNFSTKKRESSSWGCREEGKFGNRKRESVTHIFIREPYHPLYRCIVQSFRRDGEFCLFTRTQFIPLILDFIPFGRRSFGLHNNYCLFHWFVS